MTLSIDEIEALVERAKRRLITKGNKVERSLMEIEEALLRESPPKYTAWVRFDDRSYPIAIQLEKPKDIPARRHGHWVKMVSEV